MRRRSSTIYPSLLPGAESSSFTLSILLHEIVRIFFRKGGDRVCPSTTHVRRRPRIADNSGGKRIERKELDSSRKRVPFRDDYSPSPHSNASLPLSILQPLFLLIDSQRLWGDRSFHVVAAVIPTDYILVRDLFLQRFHPIRGHVVSNLGTEIARFSSRFVNRGRRKKRFPPSSE